MSNGTPDKQGETCPTCGAPCIVQPLTTVADIWTLRTQAVAPYTGCIGDVTKQAIPSARSATGPTPRTDKERAALIDAGCDLTYPAKCLLDLARQLERELNSSVDRCATVCEQTHSGDAVRKLALSDGGSHG